MMDNCNAQIVVRKQPPDTWYNQQGGKKDCFNVIIELINTNVSSCSSLMKIPVEVILLYENGDKVSNQSILQLIEIPEFIKPALTTTVKVRINDVSKNHQHHSFCLQFEVPEKFQKQNQILICSCISGGITVLSKRNKILKKSLTPQNNGNYEQLLNQCLISPIDQTLSMLDQPQQKKIKFSPYYPTESLENWTKCSYNLLKLVESQNAVVTDNFGNKSLKNWCPVCGSNLIETNRTHVPGCDLYTLIKEYEIQFDKQNLKICSENNSNINNLCSLYSPITFINPQQFCFDNTLQQPSVISAQTLGTFPVQVASSLFDNSSQLLNNMQSHINNSAQSPQIYQFQYLFNQNVSGQQQPQAQVQQLQLPSLQSQLQPLQSFQSQLQPLQSQLIQETNDLLKNKRKIQKSRR